MLKDRKILESASYSAEEKARFIAALEAEGMKKSTAYVRLFRDGFARWQLDGIEQTVKEYLEDSGLFVPKKLSRRFYESLKSRETFKDFMQSRGMCGVTALYRFRGWDFKPWELKGIYHILPELCQSPKE